jgi:glutamyl-tRNA reductase
LAAYRTRIARDVDAAAADAPGVTVVDIASMRDALAGTTGTDVAAAEEMVADEVAAFPSRLCGLASPGPWPPFVPAATDWLPPSWPPCAGAVSTCPTSRAPAWPAPCTGSPSGCCTQPTVRVRELAAGPGGDRYVALVRELFPTAWQPG